MNAEEIKSAIGEFAGLDFPDGITVIDGYFGENEISELVFPDSVTRRAILLILRDKG